MSKLSLEDSVTKLLAESSVERRKRHSEARALIEQDVYSSQWFKTLPTHIQKVYADYPPWYFYVLKSNPYIPVRHMGILENKDISGFHIVLDAVVNDKKVRLSPDDVDRIDEWSDEHIQLISKSIGVAAMLEPIGFMTQKL